MENEEVKGLEEEKDNSKFEESKECQEYPIKDEAENN